MSSEVTSTMIRRSLTCVVACCTLLFTVVCRDAVASPEEDAEALYTEGLQLFAQEKFSEAADVLKRSFALHESQETLFAWAQSERKYGNCEQARKLFSEYGYNAKKRKQAQAALQLINDCKPRKVIKPTPKPVEAPPRKTQSAPTAIETSKLLDGQPSISVYKFWGTYAGSALVVAIGGTYFAYTANQFASDVEALPDGTEFSVALELEEKAERRALYANLSFAVSGVLGGVAAWLYIRKSSDDKKRHTVIVPTISSEKVGVSAFLTF